MAGGMASPADIVTPVIDGEPDGEPAGDPLRALRIGAASVSAGSMLGEPPLSGPARCASDGLEQRILPPRSWALTHKSTSAVTLRIAATLSTGLLMGAFLSHCMCQLGELLGIIDWPLPSDPLARADAAASAAPTVVAAVMADTLEPPAKAARSGTELLQPPVAVPVAGPIVPFPTHLPATSPFPRGDDAVCDLVLSCQRAVLEGYVTLVHRGVLPCGLDVKHTALEAGVPLCHAIQDPTGALTAALLIVRRNRKDLKAGNPHSTSSGRLGRTTRRVLCAIFCVTHKMTAHPACCSYRTYAQHCVEVMQSPFDVPTHEVDWMREMSAMMQAEKAVLAEPLLSLTSQNPLGELERILSHLQHDKGLDEDDVFLVRGMAFYFFGSLLFQRDISGVDGFVDSIGMRSVAAGCVIGSFACFAVACPRESATCRAAAKRAASVAKNGGAAVRRAAAVVMDAALAPEADVLRHGPYGRYPNHYDGGGHPVQLLLHPSNLVRARAKAVESGWVTEAKN